MGKTTIEWTSTQGPDGTSHQGFSFNPWIGCTKISPACDHCYAEGWAKRTGQSGLWNGERRRTTESYWRQPLRWDRDAERTGVRAKVFCASLADVFDNKADPEWRRALFELISVTRHLDWLLLTKRPQNVAKMITSDTVAGRLPKNVWLGCTVENQDEADRRIPLLRSIDATVRFLSCEPVLSRIDLDQAWHGVCATCWGTGTTTGAYFSEDGTETCRDCNGSGDSNRYGDEDGIHWVIAGGESGPHARPSHPDWFRHLRDQCVGAKVPFFFKQWGEWGAIAPVGDDLSEAQNRATMQAVMSRIEIVSPKGEVLKDWRDDPPFGSWIMKRLGKKEAGALLDGQEWRQFPRSGAAP